MKLYGSKTAIICLLISSIGTPIFSMENNRVHNESNARRSFELGDILEEKKEYQKAFIYYLNAAELGNLEAMNRVGIFYEIGLGVEKDHKKAYEWYERAVKGGHLGSMISLGLNYESGVGGFPQSDEKAYEWYERAAKGGHLNGMVFAYKIGKKHPEYVEKAYKCCLMAAEHGYPWAMKEIAEAYESGVGGFPQSDEKAYEWYERAANNSFTLSYYKDKFKQKLIDKKVREYEQQLNKDIFNK